MHKTPLPATLQATAHVCAHEGITLPSHRHRGLSYSGALKVITKDTVLGILQRSVKAFTQARRMDCSLTNSVGLAVPEFF